jgi:hypothetical protein
MGMPIAKSELSRREEMLGHLYNCKVDMRRLISNILEGQEGMISDNSALIVKAVTVSHILETAKQFELNMENERE